MIAIIDYGAGNLFSVKNALDYIGEKCIVTSDSAEIQHADSIILPGVGAFPKAMQMLSEKNLIGLIKEQAQIKPLLGVCLGMQLLFDYGMEFSQTNGLGLIEGHIDRIITDQKIPHMGYNQLELNQASPLLELIEQGDCVYFVHSFMVYTSEKNVSAYCDYGVKIPAMVKKNNVYGTQFHPEKSGEIGLQMLINFGGLTK